MNLVINYDLMNEIMNVNEPMGPLKIIRNRKTLYLKSLPIYLGLDYLLLRNDIYKIIPILGIEYTVLLMGDLLSEYIIGIDSFASKAETNLKELVPKLNSLYLNTSYDLLLKTYIYCQEYHYDFKNIIPSIYEEKYLIVKAYNHKDEIKDTSILQSHKIGSDEYVLSLGSRIKKRQLIKTMI